MNWQSDGSLADNSPYPQSVSACTSQNRQAATIPATEVTGVVESVRIREDWNMPDDEFEWKQREQTSEHVLFLDGYDGSAIGMSGEDLIPYITHRANVRWDGCVDLYIGEQIDPHDFSKSEVEYLHICHLDEMIEIFQKLKAAAVEHFKDHHYGAWKESEKEGAPGDCLCASNDG